MMLDVPSSVEEVFVPTLDTLPIAECWARLRGEYTAVLAFCHEHDVHVMPVNVGTRDEQIWFRAAEGVKLRAARDGARMAVSVQHHVELDHGGWSVTARGHARVEEEGPPHGGVPTVRPWMLTARSGQWVCIDVDTITGRQLGGTTRLRTV